MASDLGPHGSPKSHNKDARLKWVNCCCFFVVFFFAFCFFSLQCLGNHEFDRKVSGLVPFLVNLTVLFCFLFCSFQCLGNHEFDRKVSGLVPFLEDLTVLFCFLFCSFQCLGNHEFDRKVSGLVPFLENLTVPVVTANIDASNEPTLQGKFNDSIMVERGGEKIGIFGYLTTDTAFASQPGITKIRLKYSKTCVKRPIKIDQNKDVNDKW